MSAALDQPRWGPHGIAQTKAAALHYHLNKDHPYVDGNKRLAVTATETFLFINRFELLATDDQLEELSRAVARGDVSREENRRFFIARSTRVDWPQSRITKWVNGLTADELDDVQQAESGARFRRIAQALQRTLERRRQEREA